MKISLAVWIQYANVRNRENRQTDRQTDKHQLTAKTALMHRVACFMISFVIMSELRC